MRDGRLLEPEEQELFRYTVRDERSRFAAELPTDVQDEVAAVRTHAADFAPTVEERVAAEIAAHPELTEEQARHVFGADREPEPEPEPVAAEARPDAAADEPWQPQIPDAEPPSEEEATFAPPPGVERPTWARPRDE